MNSKHNAYLMTSFLNIDTVKYLMTFFFPSIEANIPRLTCQICNPSHETVINLQKKKIKINYEGQSPTNPMLKDKIEKKKTTLVNPD